VAVDDNDMRELISNRDEQPSGGPELFECRSPRAFAEQVNLMLCKY